MNGFIQQVISEHLSCASNCSRHCMLFSWSVLLGETDAKNHTRAREFLKAKSLIRTGMLLGNETESDCKEAEGGGNFRMLGKDRGHPGAEARCISERTCSGKRTQQVQRPRGSDVLGRASGTVRIRGTMQRADSKKERRDRGPGRW